jgi:hypothetical protein
MRNLPESPSLWTRGSAGMPGQAGGRRMKASDCYKRRSIPTSLLAAGSTSRPNGEDPRSRGNKRSGIPKNRRWSPTGPRPQCRRPPFAAEGWPRDIPCIA